MSVITMMEQCAIVRATRKDVHNSRTMVHTVGTCFFINFCLFIYPEWRRKTDQQAVSLFPIVAAYALYRHNINLIFIVAVRCLGVCLMQHLVGSMIQMQARHQ